MVEKGIERITRLKRVIPGKVFTIQTICCDENCPMEIDVNRQKEIFSIYYDLLNWSSKTLFIRSCVTFVECTSKNILNPIIQVRDKTRNFKFALIDSSGVKVNVCKNFFMKCIK